MRHVNLSVLLLLAASADFHHLHLLTTDPAAATDWMAARFQVKKVKAYGLFDAVETAAGPIIFRKVETAPKRDISPLWHFAFGAPDVNAETARLKAAGTKIVEGPTVLRPDLTIAYVENPDGALIELVTAPDRNLHHIHLYASDPVTAAQWYMKHLGLTLQPGYTLSREPVVVGPLRFESVARLMAGNMRLNLVPPPKGQSIAPSQGQVIDHLGFSFPNLPKAIEQLRAAGVKVTQEVRTLPDGKTKYAFIEGPDQTRIELIEKP